MSFLEFVLNTHEVDAKEKRKEHDPEDNDLPNMTTKRTRGRPDHERVPYHPDANKPKTVRMIHTENHETLPRFIGKWFPRNDDASKHSLYCASMLFLLEPWLEVTDIQRSGETFESRFQAMMSKASQRVRNFVQNAQYYYECLDAAAADRAKQSQEVWQQGEDIDMPENIALVPGEPQQHEDTEITEEDIELARLNRETPREIAYAEAATDSAYNVGFFDEAESDKSMVSEVSVATPEDVMRIAEWENSLRSATREMAQETGVVDILALGDIEAETIEGVMPELPEITPSTSQDTRKSDEPARPMQAMLNEEQQQAHDIVEQWLHEHLAGK